MGLYRQKGSKVWWLSLSQNGKRIRRSTKTANRRQAEAILGKIQTRLVEGTWFDIEEAKMRSFDEFTEKYVDENSSTKSDASRKRDITCFANLRSFFGNSVVSDITASRINEYKQQRLQSVDPQTVVKELGVLRNAFNIAIREWEWCKDNPVSRITMPRIPQGRVRHLNQGEIENLISHADDWFKPVLMVAIHTGMRMGNIISLTWDEVDLFGKVITLESTKNGERLAIPINDNLHAEMKQLSKVRLLACNLVFHRNGKPFYKKGLNRALERAYRKVGIEDFRFHDLRHTFASLLIEAGVDLYIIQRLLGHKDGRMTQRYAHLTHGRLASAVNGLNSLCHNSVIVEETRNELQAATR